MLISLIKGNKIKQFELPNKVIGNFWITDNDDSNENKIIKIEASNGRWNLISNEYISIIDSGKEKDTAYLKDFSFYLLKNKKNSTYILLYCSPIYDTTFKRYSLSNVQEITIGKENNTYIYYNNSGVDLLHAKIVCFENKYLLIDNNSRLGVYVNNKRIYQKKILENGDVLFLAGLKIILSINNKEATLLVNNPDNLVKCRLNEINTESKKISLDISESDDEVINCNLYKKTDYFNNKYRSSNDMGIYNLDVKEKEECTALNKKYTFIPMAILAFMSILVLLLVITGNIKNGLIIFIAFVIFTITWPFIIMFYNSKRQSIIDEEYEDYIDSKNALLNEQIEIQKKFLIENGRDIDTCQKIILEDRKEIWERRRFDKDFLNINLGYTSLPMKVNIRKNVEEFKDKVLPDVPFIISLKDNKKINFIGSVRTNRFLIQEILLQLVCLHRYDELKIVLFTSDKYKDKWDFVKILPHNFSNDKRHRMFATNSEEIYDVCNYIKSEIRTGSDSPYYVIITDNMDDLYKYNFINNLLNKDNDRISLIIMSEYMNSISKYCDHVVQVNDKESTYYENKLDGYKTTFNINFSTKFNMYECSKKLANKPIYNVGDKLPEYYSFFDMFKVGNIDDLNVYNKWSSNNTINSLKTKIGIDTKGEDIYLDLHKDYDGSHCIIEGVPGSGKTEFITSYILSMAVNYNPLDVQFVIMSDNNLDEFNNKIPHVVASVSYDKNTLKRFMTSFRSELIRRQNLFTDTSQMYNVNNMDIYKYQQLYHNKVVKTPVAHLFIVIDEYEKLLMSHPNFIDNMLKISHIGPILGIHYIFTTDRKNSYEYIDIFNSRICMYNVNKDDSLINNPGQFYLYSNEDKIYGMSASSSSIYKEKEEYIPKYDSSIEFINNIGKVIKKVDRVRINDRKSSNLTESSVILDYLSTSEKYDVNNLLLNRLDDYTTIAGIMKKYEVNNRKYFIEPLVGEYENLVVHSHELLRVPISSYDNIIYSIDSNELNLFISSMIFSSMYLYTPKEVNYYLIDLDDNKLSIFSKSPLIGDIVDKDNSNKIEKLYKLIKSNIEERKKLFKDYDNSYNKYIINSDNIIPLIVIIINNYSIKYNEFINSFMELQDNCDYGIRFVLTSTEYISNDISSKFNKFMLKQESNEIYDKVFNKKISNYPEDVFGRGITCVKDDICEFQLSHPNPKNKDFNDFVIEQCIYCKEEYDARAQNIPEIPDKLIFKQFKHEIGKSKEMIIGYDNDLKTVKYDFDNKKLTLISGLNLNVVSKFVNPLIKQFAYLNRNDVIVIDASNNNIGNNIINLKYINNDYDNGIVLLNNYFNKLFEENKIKDKNRTLFINGISNLYKQLNNDSKKILSDLITKSNKISTINIIIVDTYEKIMKFSNELWYNDMVNTSEGIWVGNGIEGQSLFKYKNSLQNNIKNNYCYVIKNNIPILTQYVESFDILNN